MCYNSYLAELDKIKFYKLTSTNKIFEDILKEMVRIDFDENHLLIDFQDNSDEPLL